jgi:uncharacterized protein (TIGR03435 family)
MNTFLAVVVAGILYTSLSQAQLAAPRPEFEVASIKPNIEGGPRRFMGMKSPGTFSAENEGLTNLIQRAYGVSSGQRNWLQIFVAPGQGVPILGGPAWISSERYDITAKWNAAPIDGPRSIQSIEKAESEMNLMLRTLLERRFQLRLHRETRDLPVYDLTVANAGKLKRGPCVTFDPDNLATQPGQPPPDYCGASRLGRRGVDWTLDGTGMKMSQLADTLSFLIASRTVIDKTGFAGTFDAHLRWTPGPGEFGAGQVPASPDDAAESVFTVLQEQLGLKLRTGRGPVEVLVIDSAEKPSAN